MSVITEVKHNQMDHLSQPLKEIALIIAAPEMLQINIANRLNHDFHYQVHTRTNIDEGLHYLTHMRTNLVIVDIDAIDQESIERLCKVFGHVQIPCLFIGTDPGFLHKLQDEIDNGLISFLPKAILNTMFRETLTLLLKKNCAPQKMYKRFLAVSTIQKPTSFYILAWSLLLEPVLKILYLKVNTAFDWEILARTIFSIEGFANNFEFWGLFPLAGYALLSVSAWSFLFFIGLQVYALYAYFSYEKFTWPYVAESPFISVSFLLAINTALVLYFAVPANRRPYWNQMRRIWRNTARYTTNLKSQFKWGEKQVGTTITNISETGAYFTSAEGLDIGQKMQIKIPINGELKELEAVVRRAQDTAHESYTGYGVEFNYKSRSDKKLLKEFVGTLNQRIQ